MRLTSREGSNSWLAGLGLLFSTPALYFVTANVLKYELNAAPGLDVVPIHPAVLLGGLVLAATLNLWPVMRISTRRTADALTFSLTLRARAWNLAVLGVAAAALSALLLYAAIENLGHLGGG